MNNLNVLKRIVHFTQIVAHKHLYFAKFYWLFDFLGFVPGEKLSIPTVIRDHFIKRSMHYLYYILSKNVPLTFMNKAYAFPVHLWLFPAYKWPLLTYAPKHYIASKMEKKFTVIALATGIASELQWIVFVVVI